MRLPTYAEHRRFCQVDGWTDKDAKSRKKTGDHHRYIKSLPNGESLYTRVSHGSGQYRSPSFWKSILRDQLKVSEDEFWDAVDHGITPVRQWAQPMKPQGEALPHWLVRNLQELVGMRLDQIASLTRAEADAHWLEWQMSPQPGEPDDI